MNEYGIADLKVGDSASFRVTVTQEMVDAFGEISGDRNP